MGIRLNNPVLSISAGLIALFLIALLAVEPATAKALLDGIKWKIMDHFDLLFMWSTNLF